MKKTAFALSLAFALFFVSCKKEKDVGPDLTTALVGTYQGQYIIGGTGLSSAPEGGPSPASTVEIRRKNNNTIIISTNIDEGTVKEAASFEATVSPLDPSEDHSYFPDLKQFFKINVNFENRHSSSQIGVYEEGRVRGVVVYVNGKRQTVGLSF